MCVCVCVSACVRARACVCVCVAKRLTGLCPTRVANNVRNLRSSQRRF